MRRRQMFAAMTAEAIVEPSVPPVVMTVTLPEPDRYACPKCGKSVRQGRYLHIKHCRG